MRRAKSSILFGFIIIVVIGIVFLIRWYVNSSRINEITDLYDSVVEASPIQLGNNNADDVISEPTEAYLNDSSVAVEYTKRVNYKVPFTSQAPYADWEDERQQEGCEEASVLMAVSWGRDEKLKRKNALEEIFNISKFLEETYGEFRDTSAHDAVERIFIGYFNYDRVHLQEDVTIGDIKKALYGGNIVVIPANGRLLQNPYFTAPGPLTHMLVVTGYDPSRKEFITNDPGTKRGEGYRYDENILYSAIVDYPSGYHLPVKNPKKVMIVVMPE